MIVREPESAALAAYVAKERPSLAVSAIARIEVARAARIAPSPPGDGDVDALLSGCLLVDVTRDLVQWAAALGSLRLRSLDALHLATALDLRFGTMLVYDQRLAEAAYANGINVVSPGA